MARTLILCPTHDHADTLLMSLASVRVQTDRDWSLVVIGDGAPERTREIVAAVSAEDNRIRYVDHRKGERFGEEYRDGVIRESNAEFVCQLSDDDLWAPTHLNALISLIQGADWANQAPMRFLPDGRVEWWLVNHGTAAIRDAVINYKGVSAGPNFVIYRREAYLDLPEGWTAAPLEAGPSDQFMWAKFMRHSGIRIASSGDVTAIKIPSRVGSRKDMTPLERNAMLGPWLAQIGHPGFLEEMRSCATISRRMARLLCLHNCENCTNLNDALDAAGLSFVPSCRSFSIANNGATMHVPVKEHQRQQAALIFSALLALQDPYEFLAVHEGNKDLAMASLRSLSADRPEATQNVARELCLTLDKDSRLSNLGAPQQRQIRAFARTILGRKLSRGLKNLVVWE